MHEVRSQAAGLAGPGPAQKICMRSTGSTLLICWCDVNLFAPHHLGTSPPRPISQPSITLTAPPRRSIQNTVSPHTLDTSKNMQKLHSSPIFTRLTLILLCFIDTPVACLEDHFALPGVLVASDQPNRVAPGQAIHRIWSTSCAEPGNP